MPIYIYPLLKSPNLATVLVFHSHFLSSYHQRPLSLPDLCDRFFLSYDIPFRHGMHGNVGKQKTNMKKVIKYLIGHWMWKLGLDE